MNKLRRFAIVASVLLTLGLSSVTSKASENRYVKVINKSSSAIRYFYASNVDEDRWGYDILGLRVIPSGYYLNINIDDGTGHCHYDFRAVLSDGREATQANVNVCTSETWTIWDQD